MSSRRRPSSRNAGARFAAYVAVVCGLTSIVLLHTTSIDAAGATDAICSIANVLLDFTHVANPSQKAKLQEILDDKTTTASEQLLAQALINVEHVARPDDKPKLEALIRDESAPRAVRALAAIISNLTHTPSEADRKELRRLIRLRDRLAPSP
jgi:hypothetical protein